ncbi:hypothetical protein [Cohnella luojiensis]|uniref:Uncharacterized protein n=1 Tax=Cohnella luojiensis TaxID=652876 RepID=A0A4Y8LZC2_9BACL|nr:hypothetical protein [Cohnella luojiensis]TFE26301.1 hypothetical protein E2980_11845 [Cohnella luojiensis]
MLLYITGQVTPDDSRQHFAHRFNLDHPTAKIWIRFNYSPKVLEDNERAKPLIMAGIDLYSAPEQKQLLQGGWERYLPLTNLITVSVDDPEGNRGACHRHDPEQLLFLAERDSSPGLTKGRMVAGIWSVTLSLHSIVTEQCSYHLTVWASEEET